MVDFITQLLEDLAANQQPSQVTFVNGAPVINPTYKGPAVQKAQFVPIPALQERINNIIDTLAWQDQWMGRMRLPLQKAATRRREGL